VGKKKTRLTAGLFKAHSFKSEMQVNFDLLFNDFLVDFSVYVSYSGFETPPYISNEKHLNSRIDQSIIFFIIHWPTNEFRLGYYFKYILMRRKVIVKKEPRG